MDAYYYSIEKSDDATPVWVVTIGDDEGEEFATEIGAYEFLANHLSACVVAMRREAADSAYAKLVQA